MQDLYLDPNFTVEGDDFVFQAHDDSNVDYTVKVTFDDVASFSENPANVIKSHSETAKEEMHDYCQQIVDRFQTGTTFYDVEIKRKKVECYEFTKNVRKTQVNTTLPISNFKNGALSLSNFMSQNKYKSYRVVLI